MRQTSRKKLKAARNKGTAFLEHQGENLNDFAGRTSATERKLTNKESGAKKRTTYATGREVRG